MGEIMPIIIPRSREAEKRLLLLVLEKEESLSV
jgi:hypothetical protein